MMVIQPISTVHAFLLSSGVHNAINYFLSHRTECTLRSPEMTPSPREKLLPAALSCYAKKGSEYKTE